MGHFSTISDTNNGSIWKIMAILSYFIKTHGQKYSMSELLNPLVSTKSMFKYVWPFSEQQALTGYIIKITLG